MQHIDQINRELREITSKCTTADLAVDPWPWPVGLAEPVEEQAQSSCLSTKAQALVATWLNQHMDRASISGAIADEMVEIADEMVEIALWLVKPCQQPELYEYRNVPYTCNRCGLGSVVLWGYICTRNDCPTKITC